MHSFVYSLTIQYINSLPFVLKFDKEPNHQSVVLDEWQNLGKYGWFSRC